MKKLILLTVLTFSIGAVAIACAGKDEKKECSKATKSCCKSKKADQAAPASTAPAAH
jgi:hypothetical protein